MNDPVIEFMKRRFPKSANSDSNWLNGNCFYFASILKERFNGEIVYDTCCGHFMTMINEYLYDANGVNYKLSRKEIELFSNNIELDLEFGSHIVKWDEFEKYDSLQKERIIRDCIK